MRAPAKLAAFGAALAIVTGAGAGIGAAVGPIDVGGDDDHADLPVTDPTEPSGPTVPGDEHGGH